MKSSLRRSIALAGGGLLAPLLVVACGSNPPITGEGAGERGGGASSASTARVAGHPLGIVALGESHEAGGDTSAASVAVQFTPDATSATTCTRTLAGCTVPQVAVCDGTSGPSCAAGEVCVLDAACASTCQTPCTLSCDPGDECVASPSGGQSCRTPEAFNAGQVTLVGATSPLTLPAAGSSYATPDLPGAPYPPGASMVVRGTGATGAGFAPFEEALTATTFVRTSPSLASLSPARVWGDDPIPVGWEPGRDSVTVSVIGAAGMAQCEASDPSGHFEVPREVVNAVLGSRAPSMTLAVTRARVDVHAGLKTSAATGTLELETSSTESFAFESP